jgi:penicillin-binding protein 2
LNSYFFELERLRRWLFGFLALLILTSCSRSPAEMTPTSSRVLPSPQISVTKVPQPELAAREFLEAWKREDFSAMYEMLSSVSQAAISEEQFTERYQNFANESALSELNYQIISIGNSAPEAQVEYSATIKSAIIGDITRSYQMKLSLERGQWRVEWSDELILPELKGGNYVRMDSELPKRATIYDRNGNPLAAQTTAVAIGVWPDYVNLKEDSGLISLLSNLSNYRYDTIVNMISNAPPGAYLPIAEVPVDQDPRRIQTLAGWGAAVVSEYSRRLYYGGGIAPHVIGYVSAIQQEEAATYRRRGYRNDERVGRKGIELWGEQILLGRRGGALYVFSPDGKPIAEIGSSPSEPGQDIYTTIDRDFQREVQKAMSVFNGAIVVLERDTGRVLAMASTPGFDPNAYEIENYNWNTLLGEIVNDPALPQFNRAAQGQYPLGSVFKIITLAAALESGRYNEQTTYDCQYTFDELPGFTRYDWTYEHFQEDGETQPSGLLTLPQGLIRSCNPFFWHIGLDLYNAGLTTAIADMSRGFGLGSKTGIEVIEEEAGNVPTPNSTVDAINLAIGQGEMLVTPLQVARFIAALGNGGTLYRPQLIEKIAPPGGEATFTFKPEAQGTLPIKPETLHLIQEAMKGVVSSQKPVGTAYRPMNGLDIPVAGKTGTATAPQGEPHAWFAGYTFAERPDKPDIAVVVIAENAGEGSEIAAPIFRRVIELYFYGKPLKLYRWEATFDVTRSPTPLITDTPTPPAGFINP